MAGTTDDWSLAYYGFDPADEGTREALCTLGNGYLATRGAFPGSSAGRVHYPGTYVAGCYNRLTSQVAGRTFENESIVNQPNWLWLQIAAGDGAWIDLDAVTILDYTQRLDLRRGLLLRELRVRDGQGRTTRIAERRLVHMAREHIAAIELTVTAEDWSGLLWVRSGIDGRVANRGVARYAELASQHLQADGTATVGDMLLLRAVTSNSRIRVAQAARTRVPGGETVGSVGSAARDRGAAQNGDRIAQTWTVPLEAGASVTIEKVVAVHTSRDPASYEPGHDALAELGAVGGFAALLDEHVGAWHELWGRFHIGSQLADDVVRILRLHLFHLLQTASPNTRGHDVGVPPRGMHGEAYRALIMWDEVFVLPTLTLRLPSVTRSLLAYRYHRLPAARRAAHAAGHLGAMFPWQSATNGEEAAQRYHLNPVSGRWLPDPTHLQRHIGLAVAYNVLRYHGATGDDAFLDEQGAEIVLEVARFFASLAEWDPGTGRYVIRGVVGPDEFHTGYPDADAPGIDNNAYTNVMAAWLFGAVGELPRMLSALRFTELRAQLGVSDADLAHFDELSRLLVVPFHDGVISQYEGYEHLEELDWERLRGEHGDVQRLDRILEAEGDTPNRYKASKQADVLMLFYLLSPDELRAVFERLGHTLDEATAARTMEYYLARTSHGSTLSAIVHAWVLARANREQALWFLERGLASDIYDVQGGTTAEGVHLGAMAGSVDLVLRCFTGLEVRDGDLHVDPNWPAELGDLEFEIVYRGHPLTIAVHGSTVRVTSAPGDRPPIRVCGPRQVFELRAGRTIELHH